MRKLAENPRLLLCKNNNNNNFRINNWNKLGLGTWKRDINFSNKTLEDLDFVVISMKVKGEEIEVVYRDIEYRERES